MASKYELPEGFLSGPAPNLTKSKIDFAKGGLPDFDGLWAVVLDGVLSKAECEQLVAAAEATTDGVWERAMVNVGGGMQAMYDDVRRCGRIIWDDRAIMEKLWARIESSVPEIHRLEKWASVTGNGPTKRNEVWKVTRLNERARFLKYVGGEYFKGAYEPCGKTMVTRESLTCLDHSTLRRHLRNSRSQGAFVLYAAPLSQRHCGRGWTRSPTRGRRYYFPFVEHGRED
jgi:hypothetical protein